MVPPAAEMIAQPCMASMRRFLDHPPGRSLRYCFDGRRISECVGENGALLIKCERDELKAMFDEEVQKIIMLIDRELEFFERKQPESKVVSDISLFNK